MSEQFNTSQIKSVQLRNLIILAVIVLLGLIALCVLLNKDSSTESTPKKDISNFASPLSHVDAESTILEKTQKQLHEAEKKTESLQLQLETLAHSKSSEDEFKQKATDELSKRLTALEKQVSDQNPLANDNSAKSHVMAGSEEYQGNLLPIPPGSKAENSINSFPDRSIKEDTLTLAQTESDLMSKLPTKNPDTYVPAGTFAKAVMIGGADASASVNAQSNPVPMLFRIIASGTLPNHKHSHLKDCVVTAAVVGDISSERGLIRLENLSCTFPSNEVVDQSVEGTIFGPEGKNGVRGTPVWREGALLERAFTAGTLSGLSEGLSQTYSTNSISAQGNVQTVNPANIFQYGAAKGTGKAMDKLADYNIQRAEQYHPIIQLTAGTVVDVVFLKGFYLDGKKHENQDNIVGSYPTTTIPQATFPSAISESQTLPLSPDQIKRIQDKNKELGLRVTTS